MEKIDSKKKSHNILNVSLIFIFSILVVFFFVKDDFNGVVDVLSKAQWIFVVLAIGVFSFMYIFDALILFVLTRKSKKDYTFKEAILNAMVGSFFSAITPSATGGQFAQAYVFEKQGVHIENSGTVLILNFIAYELVLVLYCFVTILFRQGNSMNVVEIFGLKINFLTLVIIGFGINLFGIFGIIFLAYFKGVEKFVKWICKVLYKIHIVKDLEKINRKVDHKIKKLRKELSDIKGNLKPFIIACLLYVCRFSFYFSIPFFCALALNIRVEPIQIFTVLALSSYISLLASFVPIPGASGGAEFFFGLMFANFFGNKTLLASGMLIWRFATFYFGLIIGFFVVMNFNHKRRVNIFKEVNDENRWMVLKRKYVNNQSNSNEESSNSSI